VHIIRKYCVMLRFESNSMIRLCGRRSVPTQNGQAPPSAEPYSNFMSFGNGPRLPYRHHSSFNRTLLHHPKLLSVAFEYKNIFCLHISIQFGNMKPVEKLRTTMTKCNIDYGIHWSYEVLKSPYSDSPRPSLTN
jgi:hypothetical protein